MLTKLKYILRDDLKITGIPINLYLAMSATLPNIDLLADWLDAALYTTFYRPVPLTEYFKVGKTIYNANFEPVRDIEVNEEGAKKAGDGDFLVPIVFETIQQDHSVLIFCSKKKETENVAKMLARFLVPTASEELKAERMG